MSVISDMYSQEALLQRIFETSLEEPNVNKNDEHKIANFEKKIKNIIENDKLREQPVFMWVDSFFVRDIAQKVLIDNSSVAIGITGESAAGKSTLVRSIADEIEKRQAIFDSNVFTVISADNYFNDISDKIKKYGSFEAVLDSGYDTDAPTSFQLDLMKEDIKKLLNGNDVMIPEYKINGTGVSVPNSIHKQGAKVVMSEGIAVLYSEIRDVFDVRVYVDIDEAERKSRFINRAIHCRCMDMDGAEKQWKAVNESAKTYLRSKKKYAHIVINGKSSEKDFKDVAVELFNAILECKNTLVSI